MRNSQLPLALADAEVTLSGVMHAQPAGATHLPLTSALQLSLEVVRMVAATHDKGEVVGVLDAAHLVCRPSGLSFAGSGGQPLAPELKRGERPDRLSDVYALGALMYRVLTGRRIDSAKLIEPPSHFNPTVEAALDELVLETLDEDPSERPYSARVVEQRLLEIFAELGLEASARNEVTDLITASIPKTKPAAPAVARRRPPLPQQDEDEDEDEEDQARHAAPARGGIGQFFYDLGWTQSAPRRPAVHLGEEDAAAGSDVHHRRRNRLSQFMYDLGWLQSIDWDSPKTLSTLKRGAIAFGVLLLVMMVWPSNKQPRLNAAQRALVSEAKKAEELNAAHVSKPMILKLATTADKSGKTSNGRR
jgi:hypothetical protein